MNYIIAYRAYKDSGNGQYMEDCFQEIESIEDLFEEISYLEKVNSGFTINYVYKAIPQNLNNQVMEYVNKYKELENYEEKLVHAEREYLYRCKEGERLNNYYQNCKYTLNDIGQAEWVEKLKKQEDQKISLLFDINRLKEKTEELKYEKKNDMGIHKLLNEIDHNQPMVIGPHEQDTPII